MSQELPSNITEILVKLPENCCDIYLEMIDYIDGSGEANYEVANAPRDNRDKLVVHLMECTQMVSELSDKYNLRLNYKARSEITVNDMGELGGYITERWNEAFRLVA